MYKYICLLILFLQYSQGYFVTIPSGQEDCFFDRIKANTDLLFIYEVADGGSLDINAKLLDPNGESLYSGDRKSDDKFSVKSKIDGVYKYCFSNIGTSRSQKILMFNLESVTIPKVSPEENHSKLEDMVSELDKVLTTVKHEQEYMETRDKIHKKINDSTNSRVVLWAVLEAFVLLLMTASQVYYLKRFFEVRRVV